MGNEYNDPGHVQDHDRAGFFVAMKHLKLSIQRESRSGSGSVLTAVLLTVFAVHSNAVSAQTQTEQSALALYGANQFTESSDAFDAVIKSSPPSARLYYSAAKANMKANRKVRAKQLCYYVLNNFRSAPEAALCKRLFEDDAARMVATAGASKSPPKLLTEATLPADFWANMSNEKKEALKTPAGKLALKRAVDDYNQRMVALWKASKNSPSVASTSNDAARVKTFSAAVRAASAPVSTAPVIGPHKFTIDNSLGAGAYPFTTGDIAKDGSNGIDQSVNSNCWFEASMASLADLPRGQKLLASMIKTGGPGTYVVRFPGDSTEYNITEKILKDRHINDKTLWASLIECAQVMKFPNNKLLEEATGDHSRLAVGLGCITGCKAQTLQPAYTDAHDLSGFIGDAITSKNPIVCGTHQAAQLAGFESLVVPQHAYTIIDFDPDSKLITIRNPRGIHSERFFMADDPQHKKFEMKENGVFKMHISLFQRYFSEVCRTII